MLRENPNLPRCWEKTLIYPEVGRRPYFTPMLGEDPNLSWCWEKTLIYPDVGRRPYFTPMLGEDPNLPWCWEKPLLYPHVERAPTLPQCSENQIGHGPSLHVLALSGSSFLLHCNLDTFVSPFLHHTCRRWMPIPHVVEHCNIFNRI